MNKQYFEYVEFKIDGDAEAIESIQHEEKCGNIFISNSGTYTFVCEFCENRFDSMSNFGSHLYTKHMSCELQDNVSTTSTGSEEKLADQLEVAEVLFETHDSILCSDDIEDSIEGMPICTREKNKTEEHDKSKKYTDTVLSDIESNIQATWLCDELKRYCKICDRTFTTKASFTIHKSRHEVYDTWPVMFQHKNKDEIVTVGQELKPKTNTIAPVLINPSLHCDICDRDFKKQHVFRNHSELKHGNNIPKALQNEPTYLQCRYCDEKFDQVLERVLHESTHNKLKPYNCNQCPKGFRSKLELSFHNNSHSGAHPYSCPHCSKSFTTNVNLNSHIRLHMGIKPYTCKYCDKKFPTSTCCTLHERVHTKEMPVQCDECGKRFRVTGQLRLHKKRHANIKDSKCDICGKMFFSNAAVKEHRVLHTDERPHKCDECGKTFQRRKALVAHKQLHSDTKRYECTVCGKRFAQCAGLYSHMKSHGQKLTS